MKSPYCKQNTIQKAARLALGTRLDGLNEICETQKSISTRKLKRYVDMLAEDMKLDAIHLRELAKKIDE